MAKPYTITLTPQYVPLPADHRAAYQHALYLIGRLAYDHAQKNGLLPAVAEPAKAPPPEHKAPAINPRIPGNLTA